MQSKIFPTVRQSGSTHQCGKSELGSFTLWYLVEENVNKFSTLQCDILFMQYELISHLMYNTNSSNVF